MKRTTLTLPLLLPVLLLLNGCETTSISNTGGRNPFYRGEIAETDLLGISARRNITDGDIRTTLARSSRTPIKLRGGDHVLLIQSGAMQPDGALVQALERHVRVSPYTGQPSTATTAQARPDPKFFRMAAAQAGANKIVCVWGLQESAHAPTGLETITWLPIVGEFLPGKRTVTRLTLKGMIMDTASGSWHSYGTEPVIDQHYAAPITASFQSAKHSSSMKTQAYAQLAERMATR